MKDTNLKDANNINYINQIQYGATMNFTIALSLIISIGATLYFAFENYPTLQRYVLYIAVILTIIAFIIYIMEIKGRVRTHPKQIYWGANISKFNNSA
jgi:Ca2+/H+ antiporter